MNNININELFSGLSVDEIRVKSLIDLHGIYGAARILGYEISSYDNLVISGRLTVEVMRQNSPNSILDYANLMQYKLKKSFYSFIVRNSNSLQRMLDEHKFADYSNDWFSSNTIYQFYSANNKNLQPSETPQYIWMRCASFLYYSEMPTGDSESLKEIEKAFINYTYGIVTPATPTVLNAGFKKCQMISCFLLTINDTMESILKRGVYEGGMISTHHGGLGYDLSRIRHSQISDTGISDGILPVIQMYNSMVRECSQGGKRKGAVTLYLRSHHIDLEDFINCTKKTGDKYAVAHDINTCIWYSRLFIERARSSNDNWCLFDPHLVPELNDIYNEEFEKKYIELELNPLVPKKVVSAKKLLENIVVMQQAAGMPYLMNADAVNMKSNQKHRGCIRSSNLCTEITEFTDDDTIASCNLHSINLSKFGKGRLNGLKITESVDFDHLSEISRFTTESLNKVIDRNWYPLDKHDSDGKCIKAKIINKSNKTDRPIGIGVSGLAELFYTIKISFEDKRAGIINKMLFACIYWNSIAQSVNLALKDGAYETFQGSPTSQGKFQFDLWKDEADFLKKQGKFPSLRKDSDDIPVPPKAWKQKSFTLCNGVIIEPTWESLRENVVKYGMRNCLLTALMPTATTSQIRIVSETTEAPQNMLYSRKVLKCSYPVMCRFLQKDLSELKLWNEDTVEYLKVNNGSISGFKDRVKFKNPELSNETYELLAEIENIYKTMWEISPFTMIKLSSDRSRYIDQSSSLNLYVKDCTSTKLLKIHNTSFDLGLKTNMYYLRQAGGEIAKFTAAPEMIKYINSVKVSTELSIKEKKEEIKLREIEKKEELEGGKTEWNEDAVCIMAEGCSSCGS